LPGEKPVHGGIEFGFVGGIERERFSETAVESVGVEAAGGSKFGSGIEDAGGDHSQHKIALTAGMRIENSGKLKFAQGAEDGGDVTVRAGTINEEGVWQGPAGAGDHAGKRGAKSIDLSGTEMRDVGNGAGTDLAVFTIGFAQEDGGGRVAVRDLRDVHDYNITYFIKFHRDYFYILHAYKNEVKVVTSNKTNHFMVLCARTSA
jgi:hypothetical protein